MRVLTTSDELSQLCTAFSSSPYVTVDTEFIRERTYWSQLCLIQIARPGDGEDDSAIIDPLAPEIDLAPLYALMADPSVVKVFHAARQDIEIFHKLTGDIPTPLFDTQVAAMVCGFGEQVGYETLVRKIAKAEIDKSSRFTDWSRRPLSKKQLAYALADVTHLCKVYEELAARLEKTKRAHWVAEELGVLTNPQTYIVDPDEIWRRVRARSNNPRFLAVVRSLARWREIMAQSRDIPRTRVIKDDALVEIATAKPQTPEEFTRLRLVQREARKPEVMAEILAAVAEGVDCPADRLPQLDPPVRRREGSAAISDLLRVFLKARSEELGIASKLLASSADLDALAGETHPDVPALKGWRYETFGRDAERVKAGEVAIAAAANGIKLIDLAEGGKHR